MGAYSADLRDRILGAVDDGLSKSAAARRFGVGCATVKRSARRRREAGTVAPAPWAGAVSRR